MELLLASTSPYRRQLLERLGLAFRVVAPQVDEGAVKALFDASSAAELAEHLAMAKANSVARLAPLATVIGSDQVAVCGSRILDKPDSHEAAIEQLQYLAGKPHRLITALCVCGAGGMQVCRDETTLVMRNLTRDEIERYVAADQPYDCAGSYKLESRGIALFESIRSVDHSAVTGLPLIALTSILRDMGFAIP